MEQDSSYCAISANDVHKKFCASNKQLNFSKFSQHDAQEFLRIYIESLNRELNTIKTIPSYTELETKNKSKLVLHKEYTNFYSLRDSSVIIDLFYGEYCNAIKCKCGHMRFSFEKILDIPIVLSKLEYTYDIF